MTVQYKRKWMLKECPYKLHHFCDGTPNKSIDHSDRDKQYPPCPAYHHCIFKSYSVLDGDEE